MLKRAERRYAKDVVAMEITEFNKIKNPCVKATGIAQVQTGDVTFFSYAGVGRNEI